MSEREALTDLIVATRDQAQNMVIVCEGLLKTLEPEEVKKEAAVLEQTFVCLKFEPQEGPKIGGYDLAFKQNNLESNWNSAYNVLKQNNSTINDRYHGKDYIFSYWLYGEGKIYRQKLKAKP
jgi:hypothetical protein